MLQMFDLTEFRQENSIAQFFLLISNVNRYFDQEHIPLRLDVTDLRDPQVLRHQEELFNYEITRLLKQRPYFLTDIELERIISTEKIKMGKRLIAAQYLYRSCIVAAKQYFTPCMNTHKFQLSMSLNSSSEEMSVTPLVLLRAWYFISRWIINLNATLTVVGRRGATKLPVRASDLHELYYLLPHVMELGQTVTVFLHSHDAPDHIQPDPISHPLNCLDTNCDMSLDKQLEEAKRDMLTGFGHYLQQWESRQNIFS